jgi:hypothetical protein
MNARPSLLAPDRRLDSDPAHVRVARDRCGVVEPPREITCDAAAMFADDPPAHG